MASIITTYLGDMLFSTKMGNHTLTIDVPYDMGGEDRGPQPPQVFIASLGSCIGAFVAQYCERAKIDDAGMTVEITYDKVENPLRLANLKAVVRLPKGDCGQRVPAIERVAEHCPVHETIQTMKGLEISILDGQNG